MTQKWREQANVYRTFARVAEQTGFVCDFNFVERSKVYAPGELWLAYAEGGTEQALRFGRAAMDRESDINPVQVLHQLGTEG